MLLRFEKSEPLTLGAELEFQLLNRETLDLSSSSLQVLELLPEGSPIRAEIYQSMIEATTDVCRNAHQVGRELRASVARLISVCDDLDLRIVSSGTHPFAAYEDGLIFPEARYKRLLENHQWLARRLLIFGLHIHIGMRSGEHAIQVGNALLHYLPLFLALSASSPFCNGQDTQLSSSRTSFFEALPTGGHPCTFTDWAEFQSIFARLKQLGSIESPKDLWWDIRPSPGFGTIEIRICDSTATVGEAEAVVALAHLLCQKIDKDLGSGKALPIPPLWLLRENKWRVMRSGVRAEIIVAPEGGTKSIPRFLDEVLEDLLPFIESAQYQHQMTLLRQVATLGSSADRQRQVYQRSGDFHSVTSSLIEELRSDKPIWTGGLKPKNGQSGNNGGTQCA